MILIIVEWNIDRHLKENKVKRISDHIGLDGFNQVKLLNFLPYPILLSALRQGQQQHIFVNKNFTEEIGYSIEDIPTINEWFEIAYPDDTYRAEITNEWMHREREAKRLGKDSVVMQARIHTRTQGPKWYEVKASLYDNIHFVAFVDIDIEISREHELERLNQTNNTTLSILSHDLRSPLQNLNSILELAASGHLTETEKDVTLKKLSKQVFQLTEFLDTTLQWTRANFSVLKENTQNIDVASVAQKTLSLYQGMINDKAINVSLTCEQNVHLEADPEVISILMRNIISNAIKYTPTSGFIRIRAAMRHNRFVFEVENSGAGISDERIAMILGKDYVSERGTQGEKGLGLGLKLCQQLLAGVSGKLEIESPVQNVSIFRFII